MLTICFHRQYSTILQLHSTPLHSTPLEELINPQEMNYFSSGLEATCVSKIKPQQQQSTCSRRVGRSVGRSVFPYILYYNPNANRGRSNTIQYETSKAPQEKFSIEAKSIASIRFDLIRCDSIRFDSIRFDSSAPSDE